MSDAHIAWEDAHGRLWQGDVRACLAAMPERSVQVCVTSPPYWGLRSYQTEPQLWGNHNGCAHDLAAATGKVLTGGTSEANAKQLTNAGSQYGNEWQTVHPAGYRASDTNPGPLQHAGNTGRENRSGAICQHCQAFYGELGSEPTPAMFIEHLVEVFRGVWRVLRNDGTVWCNIGDSYNTRSAMREQGNRTQIRAMEGREELPSWCEHAAAGRVRYSSGQGTLKDKDLCLIPERLAIALQEDGWYIRSRIAWCKASAMPESVQDRPTGAWEHIWLLAKSRHYFYDADAVRTPNARERTPEATHWARNGADTLTGQDRNGSSQTGLAQFTSNPTGANLRNYWLLGPEPLREQHYAAFPSEIPRRAILAGTSERGACAQCGAPWRRVVEKRPLDYGMGEAETGHQKAVQVNGDAKVRLRTPTGHTLTKAVPDTIGWAPTCSHTDADVVPCVVLDPFAGSSTTLLVARQLGRFGLGVELQPDYVQMSLKRLRQGVLL